MLRISVPVRVLFTILATVASSCRVPKATGSAGASGPAPADAASSRPIQIDLAPTDSPKIRAMMETERRVLQDLINQYGPRGIERYIFRNRVLLDTTVSHSWEPLTINVRFFNHPDRLLAVFLHEQIHVFLSASQRRDARRGAIEQLTAKYPTLRADLGEGGGTVSNDERRNTFAMYQHVFVEWLTLQATIHFLGDERARALMHTAIANRRGYYGIDQFVLDHEAEIGELLQAHGLVLTP